MAKLKRYLAPKFWQLHKKGKKLTVSPSPGPHKKFESIPLQVLLTNVLKIAYLGSEARKIIKKGEILVDGKVRKDHAYPVGIFDVVSIPKIKKNYRILPKGNGLAPIEISEKEASTKICKIVNKTKFKGNRLQLNLHDGKNILVDKDVYKTGDSILIELPNLKIIDHIKLEKGCLGLVTKGKNIGKLGKVKDIIPGEFKNPKRVICEIGEKSTEVLMEHFFVVGKDKPVLKLGE